MQIGGAVHRNESRRNPLPQQHGQLLCVPRVSLGAAIWSKLRGRWYEMFSTVMSAEPAAPMTSQMHSLQHIPADNWLQTDLLDNSKYSYWRTCHFPIPKLARCGSLCKGCRSSSFLLPSVACSSIVVLQQHHPSTLIDASVISLQYACFQGHWHVAGETA